MKRFYFFIILTTLGLSSIAQNSNSVVPEISINIANENDLLITWDYPEDYASNGSIPLSWSLGEMFDQIGAPCGECNFTVAHYYDANDLIHLNGWKINNVSIIPWRESDTCEIRIWKGNLDQAELIYQKTIDNAVCQEWNVIDIDDEIVIEEPFEYIIGYNVKGHGGYFLPIDDKPAVNWKGNIIDSGVGYGWQSLLEIAGTYGNFMISATLLNPNAKESDACLSENLTGYRIYRDGNLVNEIIYPFVSYYVDEKASKAEVEYCVTALYGEEESNSTCATIEITVIEDENISNYDIIPNPTKGLIRILGEDVK